MGAGGEVGGACASLTELGLQEVTWLPHRPRAQSLRPGRFWGCTRFLVSVQGGPGRGTFCLDPVPRCLSPFLGSWGQWSPQRQPWARPGRSGVWTALEEVPAERLWACVLGAGVPGRALGHLGTVHHAGWAAGAGAGSWKPAGSQGLGGEGQSRQNGSAEKNNSCSNLEKSHRTQFHLGGPGLCATQTVCCPRLHLTPRARGPAFPLPLSGRGLARPALQGRELPTPPGTPPP